MPDCERPSRIALNEHNRLASTVNDEVEAIEVISDIIGVVNNLASEPNDPVLNWL